MSLCSSWTCSTAFINEFTRHIPDRIKRLIELGEYSPVLFTVFVDTPGSPYQRLLDWHWCAGPPETGLVDELVPLATQANVFSTHGLTGMPGELPGPAESRALRPDRCRRH